MKRYAKKGFTLIELMVVVIIIGILAGIAIPSFNKSMENARAREARTTLELIYNAEKIYRIDKVTYTTDWNSMAKYIENPNPTVYYTYAITSATATTFTAQATRNGSNPATGFRINQTGTITEF